MSSFRFLHAADIHLDSPLTGLARYEGLPAEEVRAATRAAFDNLVCFGCDEAVDFVIVAGDLFDGEWRDMRTGLYFAQAVGRLERAGIPVFVLQGNHDAASVVTKSLPWPANVHRFGTRAAQTFRLEELGVALHGWSFAHQSAPDNLALRYPDAVPGLFNIGVLHTSLSGRPGHAAYAPCGIADLRSRGYDYWALGHVHAFERVCEDPLAVFPGNVQGRSIRETGPKGAVLVEVQEGAVSSLEHVELDVLRWQRVTVDCSGCETVDGAYDRVRDALAAARNATATDRALIARVVLEGETVLVGGLADATTRFRDEVRAIANGLAADLWIEKVIVQARSPRTGVEPENAADVGAILAAAQDDPGLLETLSAELEPFLAATAAAQPAEEGDLRHAAHAGDWRRVAVAAASGLRTRLSMGDR